MKSGIFSRSQADEIEDMRKKVEDLPIFRIFRVKISGGLTGIFQGSPDNRGNLEEMGLQVSFPPTYHLMVP